MEIILTVFKGAGYIPGEKERLQISTSCVEISFFINFNILVVILFGPEDLLSLSEDIMKRIYMSVVVIRKEFKFSP